MAKRTSLKGLGADIFSLGSKKSQLKSNGSPPVEKSTSTPAYQPPGGGQKYPKATYYLPVELLGRLDRYWLQERSKDPKVNKSYIVADALEAFLNDQKAPQ